HVKRLHTTGPIQMAPTSPRAAPTCQGCTNAHVANSPSPVASGLTCAAVSTAFLAASICGVGSGLLVTASVTAEPTWRASSTPPAIGTPTLPASPHSETCFAGASAAPYSPHSPQARAKAALR